MFQLGRSRSVICTNISRIIYIFAIVELVVTIEYGIPIEIKLWDSKRTPLTHMVDITNEFGIKILATHNFLNENNIAFSPYGLVGILVALYEGVDGESSYQIQRSMQLPWNRNVMRIGFRDIHRTLKTYFVPEEGFLTGLALNNENVTFDDNYKKVLRFYGFDLDSDNSTLPINMTHTTQSVSVTNTSPSPVSTTANTMTESITARENVAVLTTDITKEDTTMNPNVETLSDVEIHGESEGPSTEPSTVTEAHKLTEISGGGLEITQLSDEVTTSLTESIPTVTTQNPGTSVSVQTTTNQETDSTSLPTRPPLSTEADTTTSEISSLSTNGDGSTVTLQATELEISSSTASEAQTEPTSTTPNTDSNTVEATMTSTSTLETFERRKKSVDFLLKNPPYADDYLVYRSFDIGITLPDQAVDDNTMFLVNGLRNVQVTYMQYDTMLEYAYLPHLEASALRLPLDSDRYYLLVVLPFRRGAGELSRLLARMARESDLSDVYSALRPRRVKAVVPSFTVKGHVALTTDLQKLGIRDVFEPRQHDFTSMTPEPGVYVRSIEQAVSVTIRKYQPDDIKNRFISGRNPVIFSATHPFLYFVMDSNIHVALMAGKMVDPLNTRIL